MTIRHREETIFCMIRSRLFIRHIALVITNIALAAACLLQCGWSYADEEKLLAQPEWLTPAEREWLDDHPEIAFTPDPEFPPIEFFNSDGKYVGIVADYLELLEKRLAVRFKPVRVNSWEEARASVDDGETSVFLSANVYVEKDGDRLLYTHSYIQFPMVLLAREHVTQDITLDTLKGARLAVVRNYPEESIIRAQHPEIKIVNVDNIDEGLRITAFGQVDAMIGLLPVASYYLEKDGITNLRVVGLADFDMPISMSMLKKNRVLKDILNKALLSISEDEKREILQRWISLPTTLNPDYSLIINISVGAIIAILLVVIWALQIRRQRSMLQKEITLRKAHERELEKVLSELEKMNQKLETLAVTDTLTGVQNRRGFYETMDREIKRAHRFNEVFSLLMIDADYFKAINDAHGHSAGDEALKHIASICLKCARELDSVFRIGGEEFTLILPRTTRAEAFVLAERIRQQISEQEMMVLADTAIQLTVSIGIVDSKDHDPISADTLVKLADRALYQAKHRGRNQVVLT
jgi:diguanylate cyclase (GGDEF)-like protein